MKVDLENSARYALSAMLWLTACVHSSLLTASEPDATAAVDVRLRSVATLIEDSSASRTIASSDLSEPCARRASARALLDEARELRERGADPEQIGSLLDQATQEMLAAVRLVRQSVSSSAGGAREFESLKESLSALLDAVRQTAGPEEGAILSSSCGLTRGDFIRFSSEPSDTVLCWSYLLRRRCFL